jgi:hypothetical protein
MTKDKGAGRKPADDKPDQTTFDRFAGFVRRIIAVPKSDIERQRRKPGKRHRQPRAPGLGQSP